MVKKILRVSVSSPNSDIPEEELLTIATMVQRVLSKRLRSLAVGVVVRPHK